MSTDSEDEALQNLQTVTENYSRAGAGVSTRNFLNRKRLPTLTNRSFRGNTLFHRSSPLIREAFSLVLPGSSPCAFIRRMHITEHQGALVFDVWKSSGTMLPRQSALWRVGVFLRASGPA